MSGKSLKQKFYASVDASSLVVFRIGFGVIMMWEVWRYWVYGWIERYYIEPDFYFKYFGFEWVQAWPGEWMYVHFAVVGICALFITLGFFYRISIIVFTITFSYIFLLDQTRYLNHFYFVIIVACIMCVLPANRYFALDAKLRPKIHSNTVPQWSLWLLLAQLEIVLIFAGIVKLNADWLRLEPLSMWLAKRADNPIFGELFTQDWSVAIAAYGIIILHLVGAPLLLWKRTRLAVFIIYGCFHILNHYVFNIGIFPWFTLMASLLFFDPDWPRQFKHFLLKPFRKDVLPPAESISKGINDVQWLPKPLYHGALVCFIVIWIGLQTLIPLRHWLYPGYVSWTEEGHRFSWQMKLRDKRGTAVFYVTYPATNTVWQVDTYLYLTEKQARKMAKRPDMILQFAHFLAERWQQDYQFENVEVRVSSSVSLNGREYAPMIDPAVDLVKVERNLWHATWILSLDKPLNRQPDQYRAYYKRMLGLI